MPGVFEALTFLILSAQAGALGAGLSAVASIYGSTLLGVAVSIGTSLLSAALRPKPPGPEDVQQSFRNPVAPRVRHYGRVKTSGPWVFAESKAGRFYKVIALGTGELDAIEEYWVDGNLVTLDGSGLTTAPPYMVEGIYPTLRIESRLGLATETHYSDLESVFPEWDEDHLGNGVSSLYATQYAVSAEEISSIFPNLSQTLYRVVARGSKVYNVSTETTIWADDAASIIRDYLIHPDGMRLPSALVTTTQAAAGWLAAYNTCTADVDLNAGGTEDRYRLWGSYRFDERPGDVVARMLASCDGRLVPTPDGGLTLDPGVYEEPTVTLDADAIVGFSELSRGRDVRTTANTIRATFLSTAHDYQSTDADPWVDDEDVSERGEIVQDQSFIMAPSHTQARRLMKIAAYRANPSWVGAFSCNLKGLAALGQRFVRVTYPAFGIDEVFEVQSFRFDIAEGGILQGVTMALQSMPAAAYDWDETTEEGTAPISETTTVDNTVPVPANFSVVQILKNIGGAYYPFAFLDWDDAPSESLTPQARGRKTSVDSPSDEPWTTIAVEPDESSAESFLLEEGEDYEFQARFITATGRGGDWTASETLTPISDPVAPGALAAFSVAGGPGPFMGNVPLSFTTTAGDTHLSRIALYRAPHGVTLDKDTHFFARIAAPAGITFAYTIGDPSPTNIWGDPTFTGTGSLLYQTNWTRNAGTNAADHVSGSESGVQELADPADGVTYRYMADVSVETTAGTGWLFRLGHPASGFVNSAPFTGTGYHFGDITALTGHTNFQIRASTWVGSITAFYVYAETAGSTTQGDWDWYAIPENASGVEGPATTAQRAIVV